MPLGAMVDPENPRPVQCSDCGEHTLSMAEVMAASVIWRCSTCRYTEATPPLHKPVRRFDYMARIRFYRRACERLAEQIHEAHIAETKLERLESVITEFNKRDGV